tara:strand:+ start:1144 stop:1335 length:192 start_codon:yes stop_codon:yes gene_type:complete
MESITVENLNSVLEFLESINGQSEGHDMSGRENFISCNFEIEIIEGMIEDLNDHIKESKNGRN